MKQGEALAPVRTCFRFLLYILNNYGRNVLLAIALRLRPRGSLIFLWSRVENIKRNEIDLSFNRAVPRAVSLGSQRENNRVMYETF